MSTAEAATFKVPKLGIHKATNQARVRVDGRDLYLGPAGSQQAQEAYRRLVAELAANHGKQPVPADQAAELTLAQVLDRFVDWSEAFYVKDGRLTSEPYSFVVPVRTLRETFGSRPASSFTPQDLKTTRAAFVKAGYARVYVNGLVQRVRRIFRWAGEEGLVPASVWRDLGVLTGLKAGRTTAPEPERVRPVPWRIVRQTLPHLPRQLQAVVRLQWLTGARAGELLQMRTRDLDMKGKVWIYAPASHKTEHHGHERIIPLGRRAQVVLKPFLKLDPNAFLFSPRDRMADKSAERRDARETPLWDSHLRAQERKRKRNPQRSPRDHYDTTGYGAAIRKACAAAGIEKADRWHSHQLRHAYGTRIRREGGIELARMALGHSDPAVTLQYAEADRRKVVELAGRLG